ncbi:MAG: xanthine phosphoribosyltransferase [Bacillota bacterium]|nr:xanthine phosphoribosyltransferase [Bacillota bacterium]
MKKLEERILRDGVVKPGGILKVDSFLNHQIDTELCYEMAKEIHELYKDEEITKILTIEASGISIATMAGYVFGVPVVFAKKAMSKNISDNVYSVEVYSFTKKATKNVIVSKEYINAGEKILIIDDFLAMGSALEGLSDIVKQAGAEVVGAAIAIEKAFQPGGDKLRAKGMRIESLARVASMSDDSLTFVED